MANESYSLPCRGQLWRRLPEAYADGREAKAGIGEYFAFYNKRGLHQALHYRTPIAVWREGAG